MLHKRKAQLDTQTISIYSTKNDEILAQWILLYINYIWESSTEIWKETADYKIIRLIQDNRDRGLDAIDVKQHITTYRTI